MTDLDILSEILLKRVWGAIKSIFSKLIPIYYSVLPYTIS